jgi:hypothetical protein
MQFGSSHLQTTGQLLTRGFPVLVASMSKTQNPFLHVLSMMVSG